MLPERVKQDWNCGRFAPSTTGRVHPGTLLAALLCWLDAKSKGAKIVLRLEDLDQERTRPGYVDQIERDLEWFGLEWDSRVLQSENRERHDAALLSLATEGRVYACDCSRREIRERAERAPDGSYRYPGTCRKKTLSGRNIQAALASSDGPSLRLMLENDEVQLIDETGLDLSGDAAGLFGDPILRRRDGAYAYHFASVLDDEASGVDRIVRGRDLETSTIMQFTLGRILGFSPPVYRHHFLFLERAANGDPTKLSKLHGSVDLGNLRPRLTAMELCGRLAAFAGLVPVGAECCPRDLVAEFDWSRVRREDLQLEWSSRAGLIAVEDDQRTCVRPD